ncbi:MAG: MBL fold metallo-hydrolase [Thermodesulfobacteriota bacterium]
MKPAKIYLILFILLISTSSVFATPPVALKITDGVYAFVGSEGVATNSGFVVTEDGIVIIDAQGPKNLALLLNEVIKEVTDKPVTHIINTHYHGDHTFGNQYFPGVRAIIAHENTRKNLKEKDSAHRTKFKRFFGENSLMGFNLTLPDVTITGNTTLRTGGVVFELLSPGPAHTDGDIYIYLPNEKVLFAGDLVYNGRLPWLGDADSFKWTAALDELHVLGVNAVIPGHGKPGGPNLIPAFKSYLVTLQTEVARLKKLGKDVETVKTEIRLPQYSSDDKYKEWLPFNAEKVYKELNRR